MTEHPPLKVEPSKTYLSGLLQNVGNIVPYLRDAMVPCCQQQTTFEGPCIQQAQGTGKVASPRVYDGLGLTQGGRGGCVLDCYWLKITLEIASHVMLWISEIGTAGRNV